MCMNSNNITDLNGSTHDKVQFDISIFEIDNDKQMVNLTRMAEHFGKNIKLWTRLKQTKNFLSALENSEVHQMHFATNRGAGINGTWGSREVALKLAQWLSPEFEVFCIQKLDELFQTGSTSLKPKTTLELLKEAVNEIERTQEQNKKQQKVIASQNDNNKELLDLKAKNTKTGIGLIKGDLGKEINYFVFQNFYKDTGNHRDAHIKGRDMYKQCTGQTYLGAKVASIESKKDYLDWLRTL